MGLLYKLLDKTLYRNENKLLLDDAKEELQIRNIWDRIVFLLPPMALVSITLTFLMNTETLVKVMLFLATLILSLKILTNILKYIIKVKNLKSNYFWSIRDSYPEFTEIISDVGNSEFQLLNCKYFTDNDDLFYVADKNKIPHSALFEGINLNEKSLAVKYLINNCNYNVRVDVQHCNEQIENIYSELFDEIYENIIDWLKDCKSELPTYNEILEELR